MDSATKELLQKIIHELEHLNRALNSLLKIANRPGQNNQPSIDNQNDSSEEHSHNEGEGAFAVSQLGPPNPASKTKYKCYQAAYWQDHPLEWWKRRVETIAVGFAIAYAVITFFQWRDANKNFRAGQRAWVLVDQLALPTDANGQLIDFSDERPTPIKLMIKNVGVSPAMEVRGEASASVLGGRCPATYVTSPVKTSMPLGPGQIGGVKDISISKVPDNCLDDLHNDNAEHKISGDLFYKDIFGDSHKTGFCYEYRGGAIRNFVGCPVGNYAN